MQFKEVIQFYSIWKPSWEGRVWPTVVRIVRLYPAAAGIPESSWKPLIQYQSSSTFQHQSSSDLWRGRRGRRCTCRGRQRPGSRSHNSKRCWNQTSAFAEKTKGQNLTKKIFVDNPAMAKATRSVKVVIVIATPACSITWHHNCQLQPEPVLPLTRPILSSRGKSISSSVRFSKVATRANMSSMPNPGKNSVTMTVVVDKPRQR